MKTYLDYSSETTPIGRFYEIGNCVYPSITTILSGSGPEKTSLIEWRKRVGAEEADRITSDACDRGTNMHLMLERYMNKEDVRQHEFPPDHVKLFRTLKPAMKNVTEIWGQEVVLYSDELGVAGRCDMIAEFKGELAIIDYKSSTRAKTEADIADYWLQTTFYAIAHNQMMGTDISRLIIAMGVVGKLPMVFKSYVTEERIIQLLNRIDSYYDKLTHTLKG